MQAVWPVSCKVLWMPPLPCAAKVSCANRTLSVPTPHEPSCPSQPLECCMPCFLSLQRRLTRGPIPPWLHPSMHPITCKTLDPACLPGFHLEPRRQPLQIRGRCAPWPVVWHLASRAHLSAITFPFVSGMAKQLRRSVTVHAGAACRELNKVVNLAKRVALVPITIYICSITAWGLALPAQEQQFNWTSARQPLPAPFFAAVHPSGG